LLNPANVRAERIVSYGQSSPDGFSYDQPHNEWVVVLKGAARLLFENGEAIEMPQSWARCNTGTLFLPSFMGFAMPEPLPGRVIPAPNGNTAINGTGLPR
jgi:hypothetical protein